MKRGRVLLILAFGWILSFVTSVSAQGTVRPPTFPSCSGYSQPGDFKSTSGYNKIIGISETVYSTSDVYKLASKSFVQCVCYLPAQTRGVQTNWWLADDLTNEEISYFEASGWYSAMGKDWGLDDKKYLAYKANYQCSSINRPTPSVTSVPSPTPTKTVNELRGTPAVTQSVTPTPTPTKLANSCEAKEPAASRLLSLKKIETDCLDVVWSASKSKITGYEVKYGTASGEYTRSQTVEGKGTTARLCGLDLESSVYVIVKAQNGCAISSVSNELKYPKTLTTSGELADTAGGEQWWIMAGALMGGFLIWRGMRNLNRVRS